MIYEVVVGNIGTVHSGENKRAAAKAYRIYVKHAQQNPVFESVYLMQDGEPIMEHQSPADDEPDSDTSIADADGRLVELLWDYLKRDPEHKDRRQTGYGTKTKLGLVASIRSILSVSV